MANMLDCDFVVSSNHVKLSFHELVVNMLEGDIVVSKFKLQSLYRVNFQTIPLGKVQTPYPFQLWVK